MKKNKAQVFHYDLYGKREEKYDFLHENSIHSIEWTQLDVQEPNFFFVYKDTVGQEEYEKGFKVEELFKKNNAGLATEFDQLAIKNTKRDAENLLADLVNLKSDDIIEKYNLKRSRKNKVQRAIEDVKVNDAFITTIDYRPFDIKYTIYTGKSNGIMGRPRSGIMNHMLNENIGLLTSRQQTSFDFQHVFISKTISERCSVSLQTGEVNYIFPLYLYPDSSKLQLDGKAERVPNFNMEIIERIAEGLGLEFEAEKSFTSATLNEQKDFAPIDILDYIYAVLHSPTYREKYKEFLKIDFPRVPYPKDAETFWKLVNIGGKIREIHLLESPIVENYITTYPKAGSNEITRKLTKNSPGFVPTENGFGQVWINDEQFFDKVPEIAWEFYIGGYQPAQKWLKDRVGRTLDFEDILHYQKIIVALTETDRLMKEIDKIEFS